MFSAVHRGMAVRGPWRCVGMAVWRFVGYGGSWLPVIDKSEAQIIMSDSMLG